MADLPPTIQALYRIATSKEVRSWSFGALKVVRMPSATSWNETRSSLDDQAIFGPIQDFACACGKYRGNRYKDLICDCCGVKLACAEIRRSRFGHIELTAPVPHTFGRIGELMEAFPILPASFVESARGETLARLYDDLVRANNSKESEQMASVVQQIGEALVPIFVEALNWNLQEADTLGRGLGLVRHTKDDRCDACGYPLGAITANDCPGCGKTIERG
jgi:hypothetical protein